jgi:hypothetical protein
MSLTTILIVILIIVLLGYGLGHRGRSLGAWGLRGGIGLVVLVLIVLLLAGRI